MDEFVKTIKEIYKDRVSSPMYGTFIVSWLISNWQIWYITFFVKTEDILKKNLMLKNEYISSLYMYSDFWSWIHLLFGPLLATYIIIWWLSKLELFVYSKSRNNYENKLKIKFKSESDIEKNKGELLNIEEKNIKTEEKIEKVKSVNLDQKLMNIQKENKLALEDKELKIKNLTNALQDEKRKNNKLKKDEDIWDEELKKLTLADKIKFEELKSFIYKHNGNVNGINGVNISIDNLSFFDTHELILKKGPNQIYELTDKGRFFLKKYKSS